MPLHENEIARRENGSILLRPTPLRIRWSLSDLVASDGHRLRCAFACNVRALNTPAERQMLEETFLIGNFAVNAERVVEHFAPALKTAAATVVTGGTAEHWTASNDELLKPLRSAADRLAFSCGLEMIAPFEITIDSPTLEQQRVEARAREAQERRAASQMQQAQRATDLIKQFEELKKSSPNVSASALLKQMGPADQGTLLEMLLLGAGQAKATQSLYACAGPTLLRVNLQELLSEDGSAAQRTAKAITTMSLPADLGPLRSIHPSDVDGQQLLLLGARGGISHFDPANSSGAKIYRDPELDSQLGFSSVTYFSHRFWAAHHDGGIVAWERDVIDRPALTIRPAELPGRPAWEMSSSSMTLGGSTRPSGPAHPAARNLKPLDAQRLIFSSSNMICTLSASGAITPMASQHTADILGIFVVDDSVVVVYEDGLVTANDPSTLLRKSQSRPAGGRVTSASLLPWLGSSRLLLATEAGAVVCCGLDDSLVMQFHSPHRGLRALTGAPDLIAGLSADRQRAIFWRSWEPKQPVADISLIAIARHRVADLDLL